MIKSQYYFFVLEKVNEKNISHDYNLVIKSVVKLLKVKYFDVYPTLLKFILKEKCNRCCKKRNKITVKELQLKNYREGTAGFSLTLPDPC